MSIQTELTRITNAKTAIKTAIEGKGVTVPDTTLLDGMAALIESIEAGGDFSPYTSVYAGTIMPSNNIGYTDFIKAITNDAYIYSDIKLYCVLCQTNTDITENYSIYSACKSNGDIVHIIRVKNYQGEKKTLSTSNIIWKSGSTKYNLQAGVSYYYFLGV